jgi:hypothetical protein
MYFFEPRALITGRDIFIIILYWSCDGDAWNSGISQRSTGGFN